MKRVLIAEDDVLNRLFLCAVLEANGYAIGTVGDGAQVISAARQFCPDLITMDLKLPNVSGLELISILRSDPALNHVPILAVTAYVGKGEERRARAAGAANFLTKPISVGALLAAVEDLLKDPTGSSEQDSSRIHVPADQNHRTAS